MDIQSLNDIGKLVPRSLNGKALNYGQGEGQFQIEDTVWGIYCTGPVDSPYFLQYEEGLVTWPRLEELIIALTAQIREEFGSVIEFVVEGKLEHYESHEKFT